MDSADESAVSGYRRFLPAPDHPRIQGRDKLDPDAYSKLILEHPDTGGLFSSWSDNLKAPFYGVTADGVKIENLYSLEDEGAPTPKIVRGEPFESTCRLKANFDKIDAAKRLLDALTSSEKQKAVYDLDDETWRKWTNTEVIAHDVGVRLEHLQQHQIDLIWELLKESLSETGYAKARGVVKMNKFLGELVNSRPTLNENTYTFMVFGQPSENEPWGFTFFGHHLCLNVFLVGNQMTIAPTFVGSEPNIIDSGPDKGFEPRASESKLGLKLMQSLMPEQQRQAQVYALMDDPSRPKGWWNIMEQRHLAGATQDNRVITCEGIVASSLSPEQQDLLVSVIAAFQELLPAAPLAHRLKLVREHLDKSYFAWIGGFGDDDPFYYRIQSPVVLVEFDYHSGIFLANEEPQKYHFHTIHRLPNGGDYGRELIHQWKQKQTKAPVQQKHFIRTFDEAAAADTGFPKYKAQVLSHMESGIFLASHIGDGGCGPGLHYHHSDQFYFLLRGSMNIRLGDEVHVITANTFVFIPAGLAHCNWNSGPGSETHLELIIPAPSPLEKIAYLVDKPEAVPVERRADSKGYVFRVDPAVLKTPVPGFSTAALADPSSGSSRTVIYYTEVEPGKGGPGTHIHEFDQYYFVLDGKLTIEVALEKHVVGPDTLVVLPAGVPHRQYNDSDVTEKHLSILTPAPSEDRLWDHGVTFAPNGEGHASKFTAGSLINIETQGSC